MKKLVTHRLFWPIVALLALIALNAIVRPQFISITVRDGQLYGALIDILRNSAPLMLVALGMTIVIATRGIDLSVGAIMAVSGAVALTIIDASADPGGLPTVLLALLVGLLVALVLGVWNGFLVAVLGIQPIIATLVLMLAGRGVALLITEGFITTVTSAPYKFIATGYVVGLPFALFISVAAIVVIALLERRTALGVLTEAVGINPEASRLAGVRSRGIVFGAYVASGLLAGMAGILYSSNIMAADANATGLYIELYAILAVVLGGTSLMGGKFTIAGTVVGVFTIQTLRSTILFLGVPSAQAPVVFAAVVIIVVLVQSPRVHRVARNVIASMRSSSQTPARRPGRRRRHDRERADPHPPRRRRSLAATARFMSRHASLMPTFAALAILILLFVGAQIYFGNFITPRNLSALLLDNAYLLILAVGMTFVILTGGIDLSVGSVMAFTGILCARMLSEGVPAFVTIPVMILGGAAIGLMVGVLVQYFEVQPFIASLAGLFLARGLAFVVSLESIKVEDPILLWLGSHAIPARRLVHLPHRHPRPPRRGDRGDRAAVDALRPDDLRDRRQRAVRPPDGPARGSDEDPRLRHQRRVRRSRGPRPHRLLGRGLPALRRRDRARRDRGRRDRRHAAHRRSRLRARVDGRRARLRRHPDRDLVHGRRAVVDPHHHRHPAARLHRRAARDRRPIGSTPLRWSAPVARRRGGSHA